jgi:transketolase
MATPVIYPPGQGFAIGSSRTLRSSKHDHVTLVGAGVTVHEALASADLLAATGIRARVIDVYSVKPLDTGSVVEAARETGNIIVAEDHWAHGGLGAAVLETLADADSDARVRRLAVHTRPTSRRPKEQLWRSGIDRTWIATAARDLLEQRPLHNHHRRAYAWARALHR